jgi:hypothetical protein
MGTVEEYPAIPTLAMDYQYYEEDGKRAQINTDYDAMDQYNPPFICENPHNLWTI